MSDLLWNRGEWSLTSATRTRRSRDRLSAAGTPASRHSTVSRYSSRSSRSSCTDVTSLYWRSVVAPPPSDSGSSANQPCPPPISSHVTCIDRTERVCSVCNLNSLKLRNFNRFGYFLFSFAVNKNYFASFCQTEFKIVTFGPLINLYDNLTTFSKSDVRCWFTHVSRGAGVAVGDGQVSDE